MVLAVFSWMASSVLAAEKPVVETHMGPVITDFGPYVIVPEGSYKLNKDMHYKAFMDVSDSSDADDALNENFESAVRFLNMNANSGVKAADMEIALVVHGKAVKDLFTDQTYQAQFNQPNPNTALLAALNSAGVKIYVCGQSVGFRGLSMQQMNPVVTMAISAMSASVRLQSEGFILIP